MPPNMFAQIDKLLFGRGHDVTPRYYGEEMHPLIQGTHPERDAFELALIKEAVAQENQFFGVCRGMQLLNVAFRRQPLSRLVIGRATNHQACAKHRHPFAFLLMPLRSLLTVV